MKAEHYGLADLPNIAQQIVAEMQWPVLLFVGSMGAGKTTLIKAICAALGVVDEVSSPTYALVNEYQTEAGETVFHFDLYRLNHPEEALDFGVEEYLDSGSVCLVEWPAKLRALLPPTFGVITIDVSEDTRTLVFRPSCGVGDLED